MMEIIAVNHKYGLKIIKAGPGTYTCVDSWGKYTPSKTEIDGYWSGAEVHAKYPDYEKIIEGDNPETDWEVIIVRTEKENEFGVVSP
jgi:hypothetical protein